ncbi:unnamed protein product [Prorocentrum cordatum]|uniref:C3H1-type domain-containing protein n=1 Tax=Prorocentrum cordatum TaxID=2364126 RepID=A0ABN9UUY3_9DINO|nr:unnamed protein product [Polarella glacialis]
MGNGTQPDAVFRSFSHFVGSNGLIGGDMNGRARLECGRLIGEFVEIVGLTSQRGRTLNGRLGWVAGHAPNGRVAVEVRRDDSRTHPKDDDYEPEAIALDPVNVVWFDYGHTPETLAAFDMDELYGYRPEHWTHLQPWPQVDFAAEREHDILEAESVMADIDRWYGKAEEEEEEDESVDEAEALDYLDESPIAGAAASSSGGPGAGSASQPAAAKPSEACSSTAPPDTDMPACPCEVVCIRYFSKGGCKAGGRCQRCHDESHRGTPQAKSKRRQR